MKNFGTSTGPVLTIVAAIVALWYVFAVVLNSTWAYDQAKRAGTKLGFEQMVAQTLSQKRPQLPTPAQVAVEVWKTTADKPITSKRSLIYHSWVTLSATLLGFGLGTALGILLAIGIVHSRAMDMSVMPWVIASQTIPILAIAPMVIVVLSAIGVTGIIPKAIISAYLSFFPVVVGMVKGLRSPNAIDLDLMKTYNSSKWQVFWKLRFPSAAPYLFPSLKIAAAAALVGTIVGELPTGAVAGLGARLLAGSYYGQTVQIWSALMMASFLAAAMVMVIGVVQKITLRRMGMQR